MPISALVATGPSAYAVELAGSRRLVAVTLGVSADGWVEVAGRGPRARRARRGAAMSLVLDEVTKEYPGGVRALDGVVPDDRRRRAGRRRRAVGLGQVDAAARDGHARAAVGRPRARSPAPTSTTSTTASSPALRAHGDRLRVPAVLPARRDDRAGERRPGPALQRDAARRSAPRRRGRRSSASASAHRLHHRPTQLSGGERQRVAIARAVVGAAGDRLRRRADRQPRLALGSRGHGPARRAATRGDDDRRHHPRPRRRRRAAAPRPPARRPHRGGSVTVTIAAAARRSAARRRRRPAHAARCAPRCRRWASRSASRAWSPCSASRRPRAPGCCSELDRLGTNLLTAAPGQTLGGDDAALPTPRAQGRSAAARRGAAASTTVRALDATVRRSDRIDPDETGGHHGRRPPTRRCWRRSAARWRAGASSTRRTRARRRSSSARRPPSGSASTARACWSDIARALVDGRRHPGAAGARARDRPRRAGRLRAAAARAGRRAHREHRLPARRPGGGRRACTTLLPSAANPEQPGGGRGQPPVRRARRARRRPTTR